MINYLYKKFKISYKVEKSSNGGYNAKGYALYPDSENSNDATQFNTEFPNKDGAELEIKKMIEEYVDFEYSQINS